MLLHYLGKFKIRNFALFMHVKRFKCECVLPIQHIYQMSSKQMQRLTMCNKISTFYFFRSLSLTSLNLWS